MPKFELHANIFGISFRLQNSGKFAYTTFSRSKVHHCVRCIFLFLPSPLWDRFLSRLRLVPRPRVPSPRPRLASAVPTLGERSLCAEREGFCEGIEPKRRISRSTDRPTDRQQFHCCCCCRRRFLSESASASADVTTAWLFCSCMSCRANRWLRQGPTEILCPIHGSLSVCLSVTLEPASVGEQMERRRRTEGGKRQRPLQVEASLPSDIARTLLPRSLTQSVVRCSCLQSAARQLAPPVATTWVLPPIVCSLKSAVKRVRKGWKPFGIFLSISVQ
jgi:hypothetical protein